MCRFEYLYYQCCPREPQFPCIREKYDPFRIQCQASLDNIYMEPCMPDRLEDIPWIPLPGPCCCEGRWSDGRSYAYGPNGDGSIEGPEMAVLLQVIREGKVSAARRKYFPNCQTPAPQAVPSIVLPEQQAQLLGDVQPGNAGSSLMNPGVAPSQMPIQQQPHAPGGAQQYLPDPNQAMQGGRPSWGSQHQPSQTSFGEQHQRGQRPVPWPSTLVGQVQRGSSVYRGPTRTASSTDWARRPIPAPASQPLPSADDSMAWYNSNIFPRIQSPSAPVRPNRQPRPAGQQRSSARQQPYPARQNPGPPRYRPGTARQPPRLGSPFGAAGPNVPASQRQSHPQPLGIDPFPPQNYFDLINETEQRNRRPGPPARAAPRPSTSTAISSTSAAGPSASSAGQYTFVPDPLTPAFVPQTSAEAEGSIVATTASEQPATWGDWTRNLGHYVQPQFRNQGTGTPYIQPQWKRQPGAWTRGE